MKKLLFVFASLCICIGAFAQSGRIAGGNPPGNGFGEGNMGGGHTGGGSGNLDVDILPDTPPTLPLPPPGGRSVTMDAVKAWIDFDFGQLTVSFASEIGKATVTILNERGQAVSVYNCDTAVEWEVWLPIPNAPGRYTLYIDGDLFTGVGEFDL